MGNTSSAPVSQLIKFDELPVEEQNDLRQQIVAKIRKAYTGRVESNGLYVPIDANTHRREVKDNLFVTDCEMYNMCKEAIPVPFVVDFWNRRDFGFWVMLVANPTVSSPVSFTE